MRERFSASNEEKRCSRTKTVYMEVMEVSEEGLKNDESPSNCTKDW